MLMKIYTFANNHNSKANFIEDSAFEINQEVKGVFFHIGGDVATSLLVEDAAMVAISSF